MACAWVIRVNRGKPVLGSLVLDVLFGAERIERSSSTSLPFGDVEKLGEIGPQVPHALGERFEFALVEKQDPAFVS